MEESIEIRLRGDGVKPGLIRSHELAELMEAIEDFVTAETLKRDPSIKREDLVVGLYEIADKSIGLRFRTTFAAIAIPAFSAASVAVAAGDFQSLSPQALKSLHTISAFTKRHGTITEFKANDIEKPIAEITPATVIPREAKVVGETELYARVLRIGGKVAKAMLELQDGSVIYCEVPVDIAIELGHRLYKTAIFAGLATWSANTLELEEFSITGFYDFPTKTADEVLSEIRRHAGNSFENISNVNEFVSVIRRGEDYQ